tara:strand:- start:2870 stop:3556 length:687 start_codon:yes stop_codon:yes gene_type:complete
MKDTLMVMGNGPSVKDIDFKSLTGVDTFGLNSAYRAYRKMNWYPTYFGCFDYVVTESHEVEFKKLIDESPIERFFFLKDMSSSPKFQKINLLGTLPLEERPLKSKFLSWWDAGNSAANATQVGINLGYKKILLIGVECDYVEVVDGARPTGIAAQVVMDKTPDVNPNYWFDDYQQKGDRFNLPQADVFHKPAWERLSVRAPEVGVEILNCSSISKLDCFKKVTLEDVL